METQRLLRELASIAVDVVMVGDGDHERDLVPEGCELILTLNGRSVPMTRHDGELIIQCLHDALHPTGPTAALEGMWLDMDDVVDRIQRRVERGKEPLKADVGKAQGLCACIARILNPYSPDEDLVRDISMQRWEFRNGIE